MGEKLFVNPYREFTAVRSVLFDRVMPALSSDAWKVLCVALRQTWGGDVESGRAIPVHITLAQFEEKTGIKESGLISKALRECVDAGYLLLEVLEAFRPGDDDGFLQVFRFDGTH